MADRQKRFFIKIYDTQSRRVAVVTDFQFSGFDWSINGGLGELRLRLPRQIDNFGESSQINFFYKVNLYVSDIDTQAAGKVIYSGFISSYELVSTGESEYVDVVCLGYQALLERIVLKDASLNTTVSYTGRDLSYIIKDAISKAASMITTSSTSVDNTGQTPSYTFRLNTVKEVIDKVIDLAPDGYFWYTDANNVLNFAKANFLRPDMSIKFKRDIMSLSVIKTTEQMANTVYFVGGGNPNLYLKTIRTSSRDQFLPLDGRLTDERVTVNATATSMQGVYLDKSDHPQVIVKLTISDNHLRNLTGMDLEALHPGMVVQLRNIVDPKNSLWDVAIWDVDYWDFDLVGAVANPLVITKIQYRIDSVNLELGNFEQIFYRQFVAVEDKLATTQNQNIPTLPS